MDQCAEFSVGLIQCNHISETRAFVERILSLTLEDNSRGVPVCGEPVVTDIGEPLFGKRLVDLHAALTQDVDLLRGRRRSFQVGRHGAPRSKKIQPAPDRSRGGLNDYCDYSLPHG
jgi:hypothetical protein